MTRKCIFCHRELSTPNAVNSITASDIIVCTCGIQYSEGFIHRFTDDLWDQMSNRDGFKVIKNSTDLTIQRTS